MEEWAKSWLRNQRKMGEKCLEIKYIQGNPYVYRSTSRYDKTTKSPRKVSTYLGRLTEDRGLLPKQSGKKRGARSSDETDEQTNNQVKTRSVGTSSTDPGEAAINQVDEDEQSLLPGEFYELLSLLRSAFPDCWQEIGALVLVRTCTFAPLICIQDVRERLAAIPGISPDCEPGALTAALARVGRDHTARENVCAQMSSGKGDMIAHNVTFRCFATDAINPGGAADMAETGCIPEGLLWPQVRAFIFTSATGLPLRIRILPGSLPSPRDIRSVMPAAGSCTTTFVLGPGFFCDYTGCPGDVVSGTTKERGFPEHKTDPHASEKTFYDALLKRNIPFLSAVSRASIWYDTPVHFSDYFFINNRLILAGKRSSHGIVQYLYKDIRRAAQEMKALDRLSHNQSIDTDIPKRWPRYAGRTRIISSLDDDPKTIMALYSSRFRILAHFSMVQKLIQADALYLEDNDTIIGHLFVGFLSYYLTCRIAGPIKDDEKSAGQPSEFFLFNLGRTLFG